MPVKQACVVRREVHPKLGDFPVLHETALFTPVPDQAGAYSGSSFLVSTRSQKGWQV